VKLEVLIRMPEERFLLLMCFIGKEKFMRGSREAP